MSRRFASGNSYNRPILAAATAALIFSSCVSHSDAQSATGLGHGSRGIFEPEPGRESDFFRAVEVFIKVDFEKPAIHVEPYDPFCPSEEAARAGKCNVVTIDVPVKSYGAGMQASHEDTIAFLKDVYAGGDATKTVHLPRIFYPPNSTGRGSTLTEHGCRPEEPARQYRWTATCLDGSTDCMRPGDQVILRPKVSDKLSQCEVTIPHHETNFVILDRLAALVPAYNCAQDFTAPRAPKGAPRLAENMDAAMKYLESRTYRRYTDEHNDYFKQKADNDLRQAKTLFSPQSSGTLSIAPVCGPKQNCPGCCQGSVTSGIPHRPRFIKRGSGIMWDYGIELWRGDKCIAELDPGTWTEDDGGGGGGNPTGG